MKLTPDDVRITDETGKRYRVVGQGSLRWNEFLIGLLALHIGLAEEGAWKYLYFTLAAVQGINLVLDFWSEYMRRKLYGKTQGS